MASIEVIQGDITTLSLDAIVNAANKCMLGGGGVDGAIHRAAGPQLLEACRAVPIVRGDVRCPTGECRITPGFNLPARYVIHTVGPVWDGGGYGEREQLASCYRNALSIAASHKLKTIAFPAISCGVYGFPIDEASRISITTIRHFFETSPSTVQTVTLVAFNDELFRQWKETLAM
ncbi:O-acetyl-ADP-ribose deacetylase [Planctomycetes bacterium CA13]|uniref:O-acetyl-ADP-ribose deacetylase n=1 Tax=Novipirellula herctigrandis TaxID=2527986 RepID=A0A5C5Z4U9_9BACT|nr:O-acetyl-ADP-ribose deacetylase [Planctomycetes bacterium CA13]